MSSDLANPPSVFLSPENHHCPPNKTVRFFWLFLACHVLVWWTLCVLTQPNLPLDMVEMIYWGQQWQWGYHKHPPLPSWTAAAVWEFSQHQPWAMYLTSQMTIAVTFWAVWQLAREMVTPRLALISVIVLEGCYYCTFMINDINNTIATRPFWALAILFMYRALMRPTQTRRTIYWCLTGAVIGLGMLCKYYTGVLVLALMLIPVFIPQTRRHFKTPGPYCMTAIALLIFLPHALWMVDHDFITIRYVFNRSSDAAATSIQGVSGQSGWFKHLTAPATFLLSQLGAVIPVVILIWPLVGRWEKSNQTSHPQRDATALMQRYLWIVVGGPILIYLTLALVTGATLRSMWGGPLFSFLGLALIALLPIHFKPPAFHQVIRNTLITGGIMAFAFLGRNCLGPVFRGKLSKVHFPGQQVTEAINARWRDRYSQSLEIVGGSMFVAGCIGVYSPQDVAVYGDMEPEANPWVTDERLSETGGMIVWEIPTSPTTPPKVWLERFPKAELLAPVVCSTQAIGSDLSVEVGVAIVHPDRNTSTTPSSTND